MGFTPTKQQDDIVEFALQMLNGKIKARAGTGKTSTAELVALAKFTAKIGYMVFNKAAQVEADERMPKNVDARTAHSLAWFHVLKNGPWRGRKAGSPFELVKQIEDDPVIFDVRELAEGDGRAAAFAVVGTLNNWCRTPKKASTVKEVPKGILAGIEKRGERRKAAKVIAATANKLWNLIDKERSEYAITFDFFLKKWQLMDPILPYDLIMLDESQDLDPVMLDVINKQKHAQILAFGDDQQQIYAWRGAVNAMQSLPGKTLPLTESFRFGPEVAGFANEILTLIGEKWMITGAGPSGSVVDDLFSQQSDAILCRGNAGVVRETLYNLDMDKRVAVVGGTGEAVSLLWACWDLYNERPVKHAEIGLFKNWEEFVKFAESDEGTSYRPVLKIVERYLGGIPNICRRLKDETVHEKHAEVVVSTAHKSKGREWPVVRFSDDFSPLTEDVGNGKFRLSTEEANLVYVAATRAKKTLNLAGYTEQFREDQRRMKEAPVDLNDFREPVDEMDLEEEVEEAV